MWNYFQRWWISEPNWVQILCHVRNVVESTLTAAITISQLGSDAVEFDYRRYVRKYLSRWSHHSKSLFKKKYVILTKRPFLSHSHEQALALEIEFDVKNVKNVKCKKLILRNQRFPPAGWLSYPLNSINNNNKTPTKTKQTKLLLTINWTNKLIDLPFHKQNKQTNNIIKKDTFSTHGFAFLSIGCMRGSLFSCSSTYAFILVK